MDELPKIRGINAIHSPPLMLPMTLCTVSASFRFCAADISLIIVTTDLNVPLELTATAIDVTDPPGKYQTC